MRTSPFTSFLSLLSLILIMALPMPALAAVGSGGVVIPGGGVTRATVTNIVQALAGTNALSEAEVRAIIGTNANAFTGTNTYSGYSVFSNRVGVGTATPLTVMEIRDATADQALLLTRETNTSYTSIGFRTGTASTYTWQIGQRSGDSALWLRDGITGSYMSLSESNAGIKIFNDGAEQLDNSIEVQNQTGGYSSTAYWWPEDTFLAGRALAIGAGPTGTNLYNSRAYIGLNPTAGTGAPPELVISQEQTGTNGYLPHARLFFHSDGGITAYQYDTNQLFGAPAWHVSPAGLVGIGTTNPAAALHSTGAAILTNVASSFGLTASGFNGNLATTDDTLQEVAQKLDDLTVAAASAFTNTTFAYGSATSTNKISIGPTGTTNNGATYGDLLTTTTLEATTFLTGITSAPTLGTDSNGELAAGSYIEVSGGTVSFVGTNGNPIIEGQATVETAIYDETGTGKAAVLTTASVILGPTLAGSGKLTLSTNATATAEGTWSYANPPVAGGSSITNLVSTNIVGTSSVLAPSGNQTNYLITLWPNGYNYFIYTANTNCHLTFTNQSLGNSANVFFNCLTSTVNASISFAAGAIATNINYHASVTNAQAEWHHFSAYGTQTTNIVATAGGLYRH